MKKNIVLALLIGMVAVGCATRQANHVTHTNHPHEHKPGGTHLAIMHDGHVDYLHDGHLHHPHGGHYDEHRIGVTAMNPVKCTPDHGSGEHQSRHKHGPNCDHPAIPHGDHVDYLVGGHLHHAHGDHCDNHGAIALAN